jgi:hypothetical protein
MAGYLSYTQRKKIVPLIIERDGYSCYLCGIEFKDPKEPRLEHLENGMPLNNDLDNLALAHQSCNIKKANDINAYIDIIEAKQEENRTTIYVRERKPNKKYASSEIEISNACYSITEEYLIDKILQHGWINYKETLPSIVYLCKKKTGHGSNVQIRNHLDTLTSKEAPFMIEVVNDGSKKKKIIRKRSEQSKK